MNGARKALTVVIIIAVLFGAGYFVAKHTGSSTTTTSSASSTTSSVSSTTSTSTPSSACDPSSFTGVLQGSQGAAGTIYTGITLTYNGTVACTINGWPSMRYFDGASNALPTTIVRSATYFAGQSGVPSSPSAVTLNPANHVSGAPSVQFKIAYSDVPVGSQSTCANVSTIEVFLPGGSLGAGAINVNAGSSYAPCGAGTTFVSPFF